MSKRPRSSLTRETPLQRGAAFSRRLWKSNPWAWLGGGALAVGLIGLAAIGMTKIDWQIVHETIGQLNPVLLFVLMATLPIGGFSISIFYLVAGARFGPLLGGALVAAATAVHLVATHWVARSFLRTRLERLLARHHHHLPEIPSDQHRAIAATAALIPGLPYFARNSLLALSGVPLRVYFWICLPIYVIRSYIVIFLGDLSDDPSGQRLLLLGGFYLLKLAICAYLIARLRHSYRQKHPRANRRQQSAHAE